MKRGLNLFRTIGAVLGTAVLVAMPLTASADGLFSDGSGGEVITPASGYSEDGIWFYNDYGNGTISVRCMDTALVHAEVPESIDGKTITMIDTDAFIDNTALETVTLPSTITHIEDWAFSGCTSLRSINLPNGMISLAWQAFYGCSSLEEMNIPASVEIIEEFVFEGCTSMKAINVSDANDHYVDLEGVLFDYDMTTLIFYPPCKPDTSYDIPDGCTKIEDWAFVSSTNLESIDLTGVTEIGDDAFYYCTSLKSAVIPEGITQLNGVFGRCTSLEQVTLPSTLDVIGDSCFYSCVSLKEITIPGRVDTIGNYAFFNCPSLSVIAINDAVKTIGDYALGYYLDEETQQPERVPGFTVDTDGDTAAHEYCSINNIKSTGGVTQSSVFIVVLIVIVVLLIAAVITIILVQKHINKRYELR